MANPKTQIVNINRFGLTEIHTSRPADVDIIFVHGLQGNPQNTWTSEKSKIFWPEQLLPAILEEQHARILVYGYDADISSFTDGVSKDKIHNHAEHLVAELAANRRIRKATERPIVFIAHSLGGLVVKRALIYSSEIRGAKTEHLRSIFVSTYGILFLGTPHKGADLAKWGSRLEWICSAVMPQNSTAPQLVEALKTNNETLQNIDRQFIQIMNRYHIYFFHEAKPTHLKGSNTSRFIVDEESASPTVQDVERAGIQADHSHMCKFESENSPGFDLVAEGIQRYSDDAPGTIKTRWESEKEIGNVQKRAEAAELLPPLSESEKGTPKTASPKLSAGNSTINLSKDFPLPSKPETRDGGMNTESPTKPTEPYFIVPPGFRANTYFVGMEKELQQIDRHVFDKRRQDGTACVLIHGQPGGGKSHLARQYVNKNRKKFSGGVFWIIAKLREERYQAFWNIYTKVVARDAPKLHTQATGDEFVDTVKAWFESRQEWLIVFDGIIIEKDGDATELTTFVPDSRNSSIIYVSRAKNLESKQRLLRPYPIKVPPLKEEDARKLLFKELHIKKPTEADIKSATEWVRKVGGLPLAIDALSHRLADTHEPLTKVNIKSFSADAKMGTTYNRILDDLLILGHTEAWNLINLLAFFGQHVPVEMVYLGLKSLRGDDVEVKSRENGGKPDMNTTFKILMNNALIERNEPDDKDSMSSSRDSLVEPEPIDMLKIHSVVQKFCCDSLNGKRVLPQWLGYAVGLFAYSYEQADKRIKQKPEPGRVSDYREYQIHGKRLWENSMTYESKSQPLEGIRAKLEPVLASIAIEIQLREPGSSQESVGRGFFQISIFDRTSSSSESAESEARTPDHPPYPMQLPNENTWGMDHSKSSIDSPASYGTSSPRNEPRVVENIPTPRYPASILDDGYESDREGLGAYPIQKNWSDATARPHAPTLESQGEGWQVVTSNKKGRRPGSRRDLGSFRPTPARAKIDRDFATGSVSWVVRGSKDSPKPPDAFASLSEVQHRSPPPSRDVECFWRRLSPGRAANLMPTYAGVAAGQLQRPSSAHPSVMADGKLPSTRQTNSPILYRERGRSPDSIRVRPGNAQQSPLAADYPLPSHKTHSAPNISSHFSSPSSGYASPIGNSVHSSSSGLQYVTGPGSDASEGSQPRYMSETFTYVPPPSIIGVNPAPLPLDEAITITTKRRLPPDFHGEQPLVYPSPPSLHHTPSPRSIPISPLQQTPLYPTIIPAGYSSQPMSREGSRQSHASATETEPVRYPSQVALPWSATFGSPPRNRLPDGRPLRKSPKSSTHAFPAVFEDVSPNLSGAGGWASPIASPQGDTALSRTSSGPGLALGAGNALGIVPASGVAHYAREIVQFGSHSPISVEDARRRTWEHEQRLRRDREVATLRDRMNEVDDQRLRMRRWEDWARGVYRGRAPYPDVDLMPMDGAMDKAGMGSGGRRRGYSAPESPGVQIRAGMDF